MKIVLDTNIIFSSFLKSESIILDILETTEHEFYLCQFTTIELFKLKEKIIKYSQLPENKILDAYQMLLENIKVIHENEIPLEIFKTARKLCEDIDPKDMIFVAAALFLDAYLWTGDKALLIKLPGKGFNKVVTTMHLYEQLI